MGPIELELPASLPCPPPEHYRYDFVCREMIARAVYLVAAAARLYDRPTEEDVIAAIRDAVRGMGRRMTIEEEGEGPVDYVETPLVLQAVAGGLGIDLGDDYQAEDFAAYCQRCLRCYWDRI